jgi:hypothetical protein
MGSEQVRENTERDMGANSDLLAFPLRHERRRREEEGNTQSMIPSPGGFELKLKPIAMGQLTRARFAYRSVNVRPKAKKGIKDSLFATSTCTRYFYFHLHMI